ncbi:MAG: hydrogenase formation protein HypD [Parvibaculaceae bacterium]|jgi:hydrogenase expression/formation protein HypD
MKFADEFRDKALAERYIAAIAEIVTRPWNIMEVCGGQTHAIIQYGIDALLPREINLIHGPGCPVCVTPTAYIDKAIEIAGLEDVIFCTYGDMIRVPGSVRDLERVRSGGGDVRVVLSPLEAVRIAADNPAKQVVFFAVGFETTAPANALAVRQAEAAGLTNFSMLVSQVLVPPAIEAILSSPGNHVQGFLAAGNVCTIMGVEEYVPLAERYHVPIVVTGFEPADILQGVYMCVRQLESGHAQVENQYARSVRTEGNEHARALINDVFEIVPREWRGLGEIGRSGLGLRKPYESFDAERRFGRVASEDKDTRGCISGEILKGREKPTDCPHFGKRCTPEAPLGVTMVSSEGACAAYYRYRGAAVL